MTLNVWLSKLLHLFSGRAAYDRYAPPTKELPSIDPPQVRSRLNRQERQYLERKQREQDIELDRLRMVARNWRDR